MPKPPTKRYGPRYIVELLQKVLAEQEEAEAVSQRRHREVLKRIHIFSENTRLGFGHTENGLLAIASKQSAQSAAIAEILALLKNPPAPHATSLGSTATVEPETEGPDPSPGGRMFNIECPLPKHVKIRVAPNGPLQDAPTVNVDNDATVTPDPGNPASGKGPFVYRIFGANPDGVTDFSFAPSNVQIVGDADPDPNVDEPITETGVITWKQPHANTLGVGVDLED